VGTGSGTPEVLELPSAWGYYWATRPQRDINSGELSSRLGVGHMASELTLEKNLLLRDLRLTCLRRPNPQKVVVLVEEGEELCSISATDINYTTREVFVIST
jgi:hypothetical protein